MRQKIHASRSNGNPKRGSFVSVNPLAGAGVILWQVQSAEDVATTKVTATPNAIPSNPAGSGSGVIVPQLTAAAQRGEVSFNANCAKCHGKNAAGSDQGPPLVHKIYEPSHHGNYAFYKAAKNGARAHHWRIGHMPPVAGISDAELEVIVAYVRELQRANGIF